MRSMPDNKAPGIDKITIRVIKDCLPVIAPWITSIINNSFTNNIFPTAWKIAEVIPIHKDGDHEQPNNNRPISLLPVISKICERIALNQLTSYLTINRRLSAHQSGNKAWHSTETSLINSTDSILKAIDQKKVTAVTLLDMSKAFDSINHEILLVKLKHVGVSSSCLSWFKSYLSERYQTVRINSTLSDILPVISGVYLVRCCLVFMLTICRQASRSVPQSHTLMTLNYFYPFISITQVLQWLILMVI